MKSFVFYLSVIFLALWLLCNSADAAGRLRAIQSPCANGQCAAVTPAVAPVPPVAPAPPITVDVPVVVEVKPAVITDEVQATARHPVAKTVKGAKRVGMKAVKGVAIVGGKAIKVATAPIRILRR